jgi:hypothetical protein
MAWSRVPVPNLAYGAVARWDAGCRPNIDTSWCRLEAYGLSFAATPMVEGVARALPCVCCVAKVPK